jgi:SAM-dependent methyltransferase
MANEKLNERRLYHDLAGFWHLVSPLEDYLEETETFCEMIKESSERELHSLLHLGCGRGHNDFVFKRYFAVTGVDISPEMLEWARRLNPEVAYLQGDMRTTKLGKLFDIVVAVDSVDYLLTKDDLRSFFKNAWLHLNPGGVLMFILDKTKESFVQNDSVVYSNDEKDELITVFENCFDPDEKDTEYELTFLYLYRKAGKLKMYSDRHLCGLFRKKEVEELMTEAGFEVKVIDYLSPESAWGSNAEMEGEIFPLFLGVKTGA